MQSCRANSSARLPSPQLMEVQAARKTCKHREVMHDQIQSCDKISQLNFHQSCFFTQHNVWAPVRLHPNLHPHTPSSHICMHTDTQTQSYVHKIPPLPHLRILFLQDRPLPGKLPHVLQQFQLGIVLTLQSKQLLIQSTTDRCRLGHHLHQEVGNIQHLPSQVNLKVPSQPSHAQK